MVAWIGGSGALCQRNSSTEAQNVISVIHTTKKIDDTALSEEQQKITHSVAPSTAFFAFTPSVNLY